MPQVIMCFYFLDSDTIVPYGYDYEINEALKRSAVIGGAFEFALNCDE